MGLVAGKFPKKWPLVAGGLIGSGIGCAFLGPLPFLRLEKYAMANKVSVESKPCVTVS